MRSIIIILLLVSLQLLLTTSCNTIYDDSAATIAVYESFDQALANAKFSCNHQVITDAELSFNLDGKDVCFSELNSKYRMETQKVNTFTTSTPSSNSQVTDQGRYIQFGAFLNELVPEAYTFYFSTHKFSSNSDFLPFLDSLLKMEKSIPFESLEKKTEGINANLVFYTPTSDTSLNTFFTWPISSKHGDQTDSYFKVNKVERVDVGNVTYYDYEIAFSCKLYYDKATMHKSGLYGVVKNGLFRARTQVI